MSNFANYTAISDESHGEFFTNLVTKDFVEMKDSKFLSHIFEERFAITYVEHDETKRKAVSDYYRKYLSELFFKVEQRTSELIFGIKVPSDMFDTAIDQVCVLANKVMSGHPDYVNYLLQQEPAEVTITGPTFIELKTSIGIVRGDPNSEDDKEPRLFILIQSWVWQVNKEKPEMVDRIGTIDEIEIKQKKGNN